MANLEDAETHARDTERGGGGAGSDSLEAPTHDDASVRVKAMAFTTLSTGSRGAASLPTRDTCGLL